MVDGLPLLGGRYVVRINLDNSAVDASPPAVVQEISVIMFAIDLTDKRAGCQRPVPNGRMILRMGYLENAAVDAFPPHRFRESPRSCLR